MLVLTTKTLLWNWILREGSIGHRGYLFNIFPFILHIKTQLFRLQHDENISWCFENGTNGNVIFVFCLYTLTQIWSDTCHSLLNKECTKAYNLASLRVRIDWTNGISFNFWNKVAAKCSKYTTFKCSKQWCEVS